MARYKYRVAPFIGKMNTGLFSSDTPETVSKQLQALIDEGANAGWEFYSVEKISIEVKPGCLSALFGAKMYYMEFDQVVFRHEN